MNSLEIAIKNNHKFYLYYKDPKFIINNPSVSAHMYIILPCSDKECIIITLITSSEKFKKVYNKKQLDCVISLKCGELDFITKDCVIDCNQAELKLKNELTEAKIYECEEIPNELFLKIKQKIKQSPVVKRKAKKYLL